MELKKIKIGLNNEEFVEDKTNLQELDERRKKEESEGKFKGGEHCFRIANNWYRLNLGYTNPINYSKVHAELLLMEGLSNKDKNEFVNLIKDKELVFYGVGVGDTEIVPINWLLKNNYPKIFVTGIDVNKEFLENFVIAMNNINFEYPNSEIYYRSYHSLFEQINEGDLLSDFSKVHFCLGNTVGNFDNQRKLFEMFFNLSNEGDLLVLGIQLNKNLETLFKKYKNNSLFQKFVLNYVPESGINKLEWKLDKNKSLISADYKGVEVFRAKKYNEDGLKIEVEKEGFKLIKKFVDESKNFCIQIYKK